VLMTLIYDQYLPIGLFLVVSTVLSCIVFGLSYVVASQKGDSEKLSAYECGFDPFEDTRGTFDVRFYLVAILFIIFDLEVTFLFPWSVVLGSLPALGFWSMFWFLMILTVGFIYEWQKGALEWELFLSFNLLFAKASRALRISGFCLRMIRILKKNWCLSTFG